MPIKINECLNKVLVCFWSLWLVIVTTSDCADLCIYFGKLPSEWLFTSHNLDAVIKMTMRYHLPESVAVSLFFLIVIWCVVTLGYFCKALLEYKNIERFWNHAGIAYLLLIGLHLCFDIADEIFIFYEFTEGLMTRLCAVLFSYVVLWLDANSNTIVPLMKEAPLREHELNSNKENGVLTSGLKLPITK